MSDVGIYHLTRTGALGALPRLLGRTLGAGERALVVCLRAEALPAVSAALWASRNPDWLPHGSDGDGSRADWQPIWLTADGEGPAPNGARFLFLLHGAPARPGFTRVFHLLNGADEAEVAQVRRHWAAARAQGDRLTYWQQEETGWVAKT